MKSEGIKLRRITRRYSSQRDEFHQCAKHIRKPPLRSGGILAVGPWIASLPCCATGKENFQPALQHCIVFGVSFENRCRRARVHGVVDWVARPTWAPPQRS